MRAGVKRGFGVRRSAFAVPGSVVLRSLVLGSGALGSLVLGSVVLGSVVLVLTANGATVHAADDVPKVEDLLERVATRIAEFYRRAENVICTEKSSVQQIGSGYSPEGFARTVESELRVEPDAGDAPGEAKFVREIRKVNGRVPREKEKDGKERAGCTDPNPLSPEPLAFLLPAHRSEYRFTVAGVGKERNHAALLVDYVSANRNSRLELREDPRGREGCFQWSGDVAVKGRVWIDPATYDVLRVDERFGGPVDIKVPSAIQRRHNFRDFIVVERNDVTIRYKQVSFRDPDEALLLPESIDMLMVIHGGLASTRRNQVFSDYRRFLTGGRVVK